MASRLVSREVSGTRWFAIRHQDEESDLNQLVVPKKSPTKNDGCGQIWAQGGINRWSGAAFTLRPGENGITTLV